MVISKKDMGARAAQAAEQAPSIGDRLRHASALVSSHPIDETGTTATPLVRTTMGSTVETPKGARLVIVDVNDIVENPFNARRIYRVDRIKDLAASLAVHGQEQPGIATFRDGKYVLVAGHYRFKALKHAGIKTMDLMVRDGLTDSDLYTLSFRENYEREDQSTLDNALAWAALLESKVFKTNEEIGAATGVSFSNVSKTLAVLKLPALVLDFVREDPGAFEFSVLYELWLYTKDAGIEPGLEMAKLVRQGDINRKGLEAARAKLQNPQVRKRKETSRQYKIQQGGESIGSLKEWDSGKVVLEVKINDPRERESLIADMRNRFGLKD